MTTPLLVTPQDIAARLDDPSLILLDCTSAVVPSDQPPGFAVATGEAVFEQAHIPGAQFVDIERDLSRPVPGLLFTLPDATQFGMAMARLGVGADSEIVLYSTAQAGWAARVWVMLRAFGFTRVALLDGGFAGWQSAGLPVAAGKAAPRPAPGQPFGWALQPGWFVDVAAVQQRDTAALVNALGPDAFRGEANITYGRPGRIPGSVNIPTFTALDPATGRYLPADQLQALFAAAGIAPDQPLIAYCGAGIAGSNIVFARVLSGATAPAAVFDGSLLEWMADPARPAEVG